MATRTWNPGEPVFDMETGEPYIDENGVLIEVAPNLKIDTTDGRRLDGDDVRGLRPVDLQTRVIRRSIDARTVKTGAGRYTAICGRL